ncbi:ras-specific guanine nucleotide-releasing factor 1 isoform X3 [Grammomys surdaster]|uniref:ras-specific guanine nucleotide-releasing factor 1 isoform X3 n=1 Tax=Grammomys surdaster TaxID=491861 RepID=UPI00109F0DE7|nr:ras-specific guanine nucleotide-releasing factor 1 isoform X3 [Grammomys surdaster]
MQRALRMNDGHVMALGMLAQKEGTRKGYLCKRSSDSQKWHTRWFALFQNMLFYFDSDTSPRPSGLYLLESSICKRAPSPKRGSSSKESSSKQQYYFTVIFSSENQKPLELRTDDLDDCDQWVMAISSVSYKILATEHESLMQKYLHLLQVVEAEKTVAKQLRQQLEDGEMEIERLKSEISNLMKANERARANMQTTDEDEDLKKIKKVQSFLRGWLCRRKWKNIIQDYVRSPHADSMRKRNQVVFSMLEAEAEYVQQLHVLVNTFLRPLRMVASSKKPPITHDDLSSIFLNSETIMFLHQIFYQGLKARIASWPTLVLADLFDILLPMLNIYQEFVRNHQYSLQILAHCKKNRDFDKLLKQYEAKPDCEERPLETFLTYPMFQIPRYILTLHELLAHTPNEHVERNSLDYAKSKLEELSRVMHDEVSETENIRKNLTIERMIVEGCDILLDTSQTFVRQGALIQVLTTERGRTSRGRLGSRSIKKEYERQCFLFTKHLIICTRGSGEKLHLIKNGVISLINCSLLDEQETRKDEARAAVQEVEHLDFKIVVEPKESPSFTITLVASTPQEKAAWVSDIMQCVDNIRCNELITNAFEEVSKVSVPQMIKSDKSLYCDDVDIRFSKTMNSCKVLQIRYASVDRLLERLTDLRFMSIDFLNTFMHSYRVFTTSSVVLDKLIDIYRTPINAFPSRSLEFLFSRNRKKDSDEEAPKSPHGSRKVSSPPPLGVGTSPPSRHRKMSLNVPIITGGKALELASLGSSSDGYPNIHTPIAPFGKTTLDSSKHSVASGFRRTPEESDRTTPIKERPRELVALRKQAPDVLREEPDDDRNQNDEDNTRTSPIRSPPPLFENKSGTFPKFPLLNYSGVVIPTCRDMVDNQTTLSATSAFAIATAGANEGPSNKEVFRRMSLASGVSEEQRNSDKDFVIRRAATNRVLNVLRHWITKHTQDFDTNDELRVRVICFLDELVHEPELLPQERKAASSILRCLSHAETTESNRMLSRIILMTEGMKTEPFENHSALEIAEQLTLLDHLIFKSIPYQEFFGQGWMKDEKYEKTPYIMKTTRHFNHVSDFIASEIIRIEDINLRANAIEKWVAVADICRCLQNYNAVLEVTSSINRSAIFRLQKTWLKVSKQTKSLFDKLQKLVSTDGRFKTLRDTLKKCDPPCVPYLGIYLTDLVFIEEGTPNYTEEGLINFSKMRMISHIIREIRQFQQSSYNIQPQPKVIQYLLDETFMLNEDSLYEASLILEPRLPT